METQKNAVKRIPVFPVEILQQVITLQDVKDRLDNNIVLTPYHKDRLLLEIEAKEQKKKELAATLKMEDGTLSKAKKHKPLREQLVALIRDQQDLQKMLAHAKALYFDFKKLREAGQVPQDLQEMFKITLDRLWAARRAQQQAAREADIEANLEKYVTNFNDRNHSR